LPAGIRVTSKCNLGNAPPERIEALLRQSIEASCSACAYRGSACSSCIPISSGRELHRPRRPEAAVRMTPYAVFVDACGRSSSAFVGRGPDRHLGPTGIGHPDTDHQGAGERPAPAAVQCIANLLDSPGGLKFFGWSAKPRAVIAAARPPDRHHGIRARPGGRAHYRDRSAAAGPTMPRCATTGLPRPSGRSAPSSAPTRVIAHATRCRSDIDTLVLGVKNRQERPSASRRPRPVRCHATLVERIDAR